MIAAIYARLSRAPKKGEAETDESSIPLQIETATAYAKQIGATVGEGLIVDDRDISGAEFAKRPSFMRLVELAEQTPRPFDVLIFRDLERFHREQLEGGGFLKRFDEAGVKLYAYRTGLISLETPADRLKVSIEGYGVEAYREACRKNATEIAFKKANSGAATTRAAYGYINNRVSPKHVEVKVHEPEAETVRKIFALAIEGLSPRRIAHQLNAEGIAGPHPKKQPGHPWWGGAVYNILRRTTYMGVREWGKRKMRGKYGKKEGKATDPSTWVRVPVPHLVIVDPDIWNQAQAVLSGRNGTEGFSGYHGPAKHLLAGAARCGTCHGPLIVVTHGRDHRSYRCGRRHQSGVAACSNNMRLPLKRTEAAVLNQVQKAVLDPKIAEPMVERYIEQIAAEHTRSDKIRKRLTKEIVQVEAEVRNLTEAVKTGSDIPVLVKSLRESQDRLTALQAERSRLDGPGLTEKDLDTLRDGFKFKLLGLAHTLRKNPEAGRDVLKTVLQDRLTFTPALNGARFTGTGTLGNLLQGVVFKSRYASPRVV